MKKDLILEINRSLEIMGLPKKPILSEQWFKFLRSVEDILTGASELSPRLWKVGDVEVPTSVFNNIRRVIDDPVSYNLLSREAKIYFNKIITSNKQLFDAIYDDSMNSFLKTNNIDKPSFLKKLAEDLELARVDNPTATIEDVLKASGVDEGTAKALDAKLTDEVTPFTTWKIDGVPITPKLLSAWSTFWNEWNSKIFKNIRYKWLLGYAKGTEAARQKIIQELGIIKDKLTKVQGGEMAAENIQDNLENIWFMIAGMRKSGMQSNYRDLVKKYISENNLLPKNQVEKFMQQDYVKNAMDASLNRAKEEAGVLTARWVQNMMSTIPGFNLIQSMWKKGWKISQLSVKDWMGAISPNFEKLFYYVVYKSPFSPKEIAEFAMRTGRNAAIFEAIGSFVVFETIIRPTLSSLLRVAIENWVTIPEVKRRLELINELCPYGIIKDEKGNPIDCEQLKKQLEYANFESFWEYFKNEMPTTSWFKDWWSRVEEKSSFVGKFGAAVFGGLWDIVTSVTYSDEFIESTNENVLKPLIFREGKPIWEKWRQEMEIRYDESMADIYSKLETEGFDTKNPKVFEEQVRKKIEDLKKKYPAMEEGRGDFDDTLDGFKRFLIDVNKFNKMEADKATEKTEKINGRDRKIYFMDGSKPFDEVTNPKFIWFANHSFYPLGQTPLEQQ